MRNKFNSSQLHQINLYKFTATGSTAVESSAHTRGVPGSNPDIVLQISDENLIRSPLIAELKLGMMTKESIKITSHDEVIFTSKNIKNYRIVNHFTHQLRNYVYNYSWCK